MFNLGDKFEILRGSACYSCRSNVIITISSISSPDISFHSACKKCNRPATDLTAQGSTVLTWIQNKFIVPYSLNESVAAKPKSKTCKWNGQTKVVMPRSSLQDNTDEVKHQIKKQLVPVSWREWAKCGVDGMAQVDIKYDLEKDKVSGALRCKGCFPW